MIDYALLDKTQDEIYALLQEQSELAKQIEALRVKWTNCKTRLERLNRTVELIYEKDKREQMK